MAHSNQQTTPQPNQPKENKGININAFALIFGVIILSAVLTYILPAGNTSGSNRTDVRSSILIPSSSRISRRSDSSTCSEASIPEW